jgi:hypothetical protein
VDGVGHVVFDQLIEELDWEYNPKVDGVAVEGADWLELMPTVEGWTGEVGLIELGHHLILIESIS